MYTDFIYTPSGALILVVLALDEECTKGMYNTELVE
jgi:hypothetical protein